MAIAKRVLVLLYCRRVLGRFLRAGLRKVRGLLHRACFAASRITIQGPRWFRCENRKPGSAYHTPISFLIEGDGQRVLGACLSACCQVAGNEKATILDRLRNAVILLSHADAAPADPISLSLSFSAIEALVCEKDEVPVNKQIKRHVSTLLVQDASKRKSREKVLGQLYEIRSQVMHGNQVSASDRRLNAFDRLQRPSYAVS